MSSEKYLIFDLDDDKSTKLGEIISNPTCKKIINLLADKEMGETEIAQALGSPLNTTEYNIKKLVHAGLIEEAKSWWSVKGKKMPSYRLVNKAIVISPRKGNIYNKIKGVLPIVLITGMFTALFFWFEETGESVSHNFSGVPQLAEKAVAAADSVGATVSNASHNTWFLAIIWIVALLFVLYSFFKEEK